MAEPTPCCPLHAARAVDVVEAVRARDIIAAYRRRFGVDVRPLFTGIDAVTLYRCVECGLGFWRPPVAGDAAFYAQLSRHDWYYLRGKGEHAVAAGYIKERDAVLEVGCGDGLFATMLTDSARYAGLEFNPDALASARAKRLDVSDRPVERYVRSRPGIFDVVCAFQVLEHVPEPVPFVTACLEGLRPGGLLILAVPNTESYVGAETDNILNMPPHHITWWSEDAFRFLADRLGTEVVAVEREMMTSRDQRRVFLRSVALRAFARAFGNQRRFVLGGPLYRATLLPARALARFLLLGLDFPGQAPHGHSLTVVLCKPAVIVQ